MSQDDKQFQKVEWSGDQYKPADDDLDELPAQPRKQISAEDHELLVLAARALNADFVETEGEEFGDLNFPDRSVVHAWNPLLFSGDTFELGLKLGLFHENQDFARMLAEEIGPAEEKRDVVAAGRRATVRAAAEIIRLRKFLNESS
jgi:hypothetical protein